MRSEKQDAVKLTRPRTLAGAVLLLNACYFRWRPLRCANNVGLVKLAVFGELAPQHMIHLGRD